MRLAIISDIHSNMEAFQQTLADIKNSGVDLIVNLGDSVGYGPEPEAVIAVIQKEGIPVLDVDQIIDITLNQMREEFRSSREKRYHTHPKTCALFEHEYEVPISDDEWKKTAGKVEKCLRNFYSSETFGMLKELPRKMWLEVENFSSFNMNNTKI